MPSATHWSIRAAGLLATTLSFLALAPAQAGYWDSRFLLPGGQGVNGIVNAVAVSGGNVYVGGAFTRAGSVNANNIAMWNGRNWSALGAGVNNQVWTIAVQGTNVYAGGKFTEAGGIPVNFIARWNGTSWAPLGSGWNNGVTGQVYALAMRFTLPGRPPIVYAGGIFGSAIQSNGTILPVNYVALWNGTAWSALGSGVSSTVYAVTVDGTSVYVGGEFTSAGSVSTARVAKWTGTWSALTDLFGRNGANGYVSEIAVIGSDVYVGGNFTAVSGGVVPASNIARFDGASSLWRSVGGGVNSVVYTMASSGSSLYLGGPFTQAGTLNVGRIASWNDSSWSNLSGGLNGSPEALAAESGQVYVGGSFSSEGENFAIWHENDASDVDQDGIPEFADNCTLLSNASQCDSDGDGYGNRCDGDLNNNGATNAVDTTLFRQQLGRPSVGPTYNKADLNCDAAVNAQDTTLFRARLGSPPGPSGLVP